MKVQHPSLLLCLSFLLTPALIVHADVAYTWVDKDGVLHFSDTPQQGSKSIALPDLKASAPPPAFEKAIPVKDTHVKATTSEKPEPSHQQPEPNTKLTLSLVTPTHDASIRSNRGMLSIQAKASRKLGSSEQLQLILDGKPYGAPQTHFEWHLRNIDRGSHTIAVQAKRSGKLIASTSPITVHLLRTSVKKAQ